MKGVPVEASSALLVSTGPRVMGRQRTFPETGPAFSLPLSDRLDHVPNASLHDDRHRPFRLCPERLIFDAGPSQVTGRRGGSGRHRRLERRAARVLQVLKVRLGVALVFDLRFVLEDQRLPQRKCSRGKVNGLPVRLRRYRPNRGRCTVRRRLAGPIGLARGSCRLRTAGPSRLP